MLMACQENGKMLNAVEDTVNPLDRFLCPACKEAVRFKNGKVMRPHFAHISLKECHFYTENESAEHITNNANNIFFIFKPPNYLIILLVAHF